jgi:GTP-binding protein YchF
MKLGIIGLPQSGKTTVFEALTRNISETAHKGEDRIGTIQVPDNRIDELSHMYEPLKTIYAQVEYFLPATARAQKKDSSADQSIWTAARDCDALIQVVKNHSAGDKSPRADLRNMEQELILADLVVAEKRLERIEHDHRRGKKMDPEEHSLLMDCRRNLENEIPLRRIGELSAARKLRGFAFLSAKPLLVLFNNDEDDENPPEDSEPTHSENSLVMRGKLEHELSQMSADDAADFLKEFNIGESATDRVIRKSYEILGLISFFTVGKDEVRAWTIRQGTPAVEAAGTVHSDMQKGFIRAEVLAYRDLMEAGTYAEARKRGTVRLEGKTYDVKDGDIINFRFNV